MTEKPPYLQLLSGTYDGNTVMCRCCPVTMTETLCFLQVLSGNYDEDSKLFAGVIR